MLAFLIELAKAPCNEARSLYLPPRLPHIGVENLPKDIPPGIVELAHSSKTGSVIFQSPGVSYLVIPPFPITEKATVEGIFVEPLHSLLKHNYRIALILVRLGAYAIGICDGENLVSSKVGTGLVHGRHKKGGSSAHRFERHRDKQIEYFLSRVCRHAREQLQPQALDYVIYGGARTTIQLLKKRCPFMEQFDECNLPPLLDIPEPRQAVLLTAVSRVWSTTVMEWQED
jgi:hypothetical protein